MKTKWYNYIKMDGSPFTGRRPLVQLVAGGSDQASGQDSRGWRSGQGAKKTGCELQAAQTVLGTSGKLEIFEAFYGG